MKRTCGSRMIIAAALALPAVAGCGATAGGTAPQPQATQESLPPKARSTLAAFAGHRWQVVSITRDGQQTPIPARYDVYLTFTPDGRFSASDSVNSHSGNFSAATGSFTTSAMTTSAAGYAGSDPVTLLAIGAISAFSNGARATATVTGDRLDVIVGRYQLRCRRDGRA